MSTEHLLEQYQWVRRLARALVHDPHLADDVAHDAWLAAAQAPPVEGGALKGWLRTVVRRRSQELHRQARARTGREERVARAEAVPADETLRERIETGRRLAEVVMAMEEPYRRTILLRYFEERSPAQIARSEAISVNTVKSRLRRGVAMLRTTLDGEFGGDRRDWIRALAPLAALAGSGAGRGRVRAIAAAAVGGLGAGIALLWPQSPSSSPGPSPAAARIEVSAAEAPGPPTVATSPADRSTAPVQPTSALQSEWLDETLVIHAVDAGSGESVPGVQVWLYDRLDSHLNGGGRERTGPDPLWLFRSHGASEVADGDGVVQVPWSGLGMRATVHGARWSGEVRVGRAGWGDVDLELFPNRPLSIRVVDPEGEPLAGVPIALGWEGRRAPVRGQRTDPDGRVTLLDAAALLRKRRDPDARLEISAVIPMAGAVVRSLVVESIDDLPTEVVELACPALGTIDLSHPDGADVAGRRITVEAEVPGTGETKRAQVWLDGDGRAEIRCGLDVPLSLVWGPAEGETRMPVAPLTSSGAVRSLTMIPDAPPSTPSPPFGMDLTLVRLTGTLVDPSGAPVTSVPPSGFHHLVGERGQSSGNADVTMGAGGGVTIEIWEKTGELGDGETSLVELTRETPSGRQFVSIEVPRTGPEGVADVGTVALVPFREYASGTAVDGAGNPLPRARLAVEAELQMVSPTGRAFGQPRFWPLAALDTRTRDDGSFVVDGPPLESSVIGGRGEPTGRLRLRAEVQDGEGDFVAFEPGEVLEVAITSVVPLRMATTGVPPAARRRLSALLTGANARRRGARVATDGTFSWSRIREDTYRVEITHSSLREPLLVIEDVEVQRGGDGDPRLESVDLSGRFLWNTVRVLDASGEPCRREQVWISDDAGQQSFRLSTDEAGEVTIGRATGSTRWVRPFDRDPDGEWTILTEDVVLRKE